ncbi:hypothetical protein V5799_018985 [Amblyomma americanum]|uniref:Uncharacterized protein n=1 Tax=Amblyomma americanum TaxID=6943 RepID=A0AAQ4EY52_AMBAM
MCVWFVVSATKPCADHALQGEVELVWNAQVQSTVKACSMKQREQRPPRITKWCTYGTCFAPRDTNKFARSAYIR